MKKLNFKLILSIVMTMMFSLYVNAQTVYFTEDFENYGSTIPNQGGWVSNPAAGNTWQIGNGSQMIEAYNIECGPGSAYEGDSCANFDDWNYPEGTVCEMTTPSIDLSASTHPILKFWYWNKENAEKVDTVQILVSNDNGANFTHIYTTPNIANDWTKLTVNLDNYATQTIQIKFKITGAFGMTNSNIDLITVEEQASCPEVEDLIVSNTTETSTVFSWTPTGEETNWTVEYGYEGFTLGSGISVDVTDTFINVASLLSDSIYDIYVKAVCGASDESAVTGPLTFKTIGLGDSCSAPIEATLPADFTNNIWSDLSQTTRFRLNTTDTTCLSSDYLDKGNDIFYKFELTEDMKITITVDPKNTQMTGFLIASDCPSASNCISYQGSFANPPAPYSINELELTAGTYYVMVDRYNLGGEMVIPEFDIQIEKILCAVPTALNVTDITTTSAKLAWTTGGGATTWDVILLPAGTDTTGIMGTASSVTTNPLPVDTLTVGTNYEFYVRDDCGEFKSLWVGPYAFGTECNVINTFPYLENFEGGTIPVCWKKNIPADNANDIVVDTSANNTVDGHYSLAMTSYAQSPTIDDYHQYITTPAFHIDAAYTKFSFWAGKFNYYATPTDTLSFGIITATDTIWTGANTPEGSFGETQFDLSPYIGQDIKIIFHYFGDYQYYINIDDVSIDLGVSVNDISENNSLNIYPNPNNGEFTINANFNETQNIKLDIVDMYGRVIYSDNYNNNIVNQNIDVKGFAKGIYYVRLTTDNNSMVKKVIIK